MMVSCAYSVGCLDYSPFRFSQDLQSKNGIVSATLSISNSKGPEGAGGTPLSIMCFTDREKSAIMTVACTMGGADGEAHVNEFILIKLVSDKIGMEIGVTPTMDVDDAIRVIAAMTPAEKRFVCAFLGKIITIDGDVDAREMLLWGLLTERCNFPEMNLAEAERYIGEFLN